MDYNKWIGDSQALNTSHRVSMALKDSATDDSNQEL